MKKKRRATLNDGCNPELISGARFDGVLEIPFIEKPEKIVIPNDITPFTKRHRVKPKESAIGFYEMDEEFAEILIDPEAYIEEFREYQAILSPDCSLYRDMPLEAQLMNIYRSRAIGCFYQRKGSYVIPQVRWGSEATYTTSILSERAAFLGVEKKSIVAIGTYGCIRTKEDKYYFHAGLNAMLETLEPKVVLVYGSMPKSIFGTYLNYTQFVRFDDWTTSQHGGRKNGQRKRQ